MTGATLRFDSIKFSQGDFTLDVDAIFPAGALTVILGPSGCGKTTLLDLAAGFLQPEEGRVLEGELDVTPLPPEGRRVGVVFQDHALFPHMTVKNNILFGPLSRGVSRAEALKRAERLMDLVKLDGYRNRRPASLSGGEKQRVALARALAIDPDILILDEPFSALDAALRREMRGEVKRIQRETGITAILVTHDQEEALAIADHLAVMDRGRIMNMGTPENLWNSPSDLFTAFFLGRSTRLEVKKQESGRDGEILLHTAAGIITMPADSLKNLGRKYPDRGVILVRPEGMKIDPEGPLSGKIARTEYAGGLWKILVSVPDGAAGDTVMLETADSDLPAQGEIVRFRPDPDYVRFLPGPVSLVRK